MAFLDSAKKALTTSLKTFAFTNPATAIPMTFYETGKFLKNKIFGKPITQNQAPSTINASAMTKALQTPSPGNLFPLPSPKISISSQPLTQKTTSTLPIDSPTTSSNYNSYGNGGSNSNYNYLTDTSYTSTAKTNPMNFAIDDNKPSISYMGEEKQTNPSSSKYNEQLNALQDKINTLNDSFANYLKPSQDENDTVTQLDNIQARMRALNASKELGLVDAANRPIAMNFITGEQANIERRGNANLNALAAEAEPLTTRLARLQTERQKNADLAKYQLENLKSEYGNLQSQFKPMELNGNLVRLNPETGQYETIFRAPSKDAEGFTLGEGQMRFDAQGKLIASGAPKTAAEQLTNDIKEYNFARSQGYQGSFTDYKNSQAGSGSGLPAAYREYQLSQSDPGFAQYLNKNAGGLNQQQLNAIQNSPEGKQLLAIQDLQSKLNAYRQEASQPGGFDSVGSRKAILDSLYADLKIAYKNAAGLGALTGPDVAIITEAIKPISGITNYPGYLASGGQKGVLNSIDQALATINRQADTNYRSLISKYPDFQNTPYIQNLNPEIQQLRNEGYTDQQIQQFLGQRGFKSDLSKSQNYLNTDVREIKDFSRVDTVMGRGVATGITAGSPVWKWGLDLVIDGGKGAPVKAPFGGKVVYAGNKGGFGNTVRVELDNGDQIWLSHLDAINVKPGQRINPGIIVGTQGNSGTVLGKGGKPNAEARAKGSGTHVDITMRKPNGSYYTSQQVASILGARKA